MAKKKRRIGTRKRSSEKSKPGKFDAIKHAKKPTKKPPLWNLDYGVTYSSLSTWEQCPEQFALAYIDGWTSKRIHVPFEFGHVMHSAIEHQFGGKTPEEVIYHVTEAYYKKRLPTLLHSSERDVLDTICETAKITFPAYCRYWQQDDAGLDWLVREGQFSVPYKLAHPAGFRTLRLRGMRDGVYRTRKTGIVGLFETKNKSRISEQEIKDGLHADMQTLMYALATQLETGHTPTQVLYNVIRRSDIYRRKGESLGDLMKRLKEDIQKRPDFYFMRFIVDLLPSDVEEFRRKTLDPLLVRFVDWWESVKKNPDARGRWKSPYHFRSLQNLIGKYGKANLWEVIVNDNTRSYYRRSAVFPELEPVE